jgi:MoaA/NifB/PqqE/SkfB family radical SAM enzyme
MSKELKWSEYDFSQIPFDDIEHFGTRSMLDRDTFTVSWLLGRFCNYRCSYCWPYARSDKKDHRPLAATIGTINEIKRQARERGFNSFHFSLSGGEPTFHPSYLDIVRHLNDDVRNCNFHSLHMTSNVSRPIKWFEEYYQASKDMHRVSITASYHREHVNTKKKIIEFADKLEFCQEHNIQITINIVMVPEFFEKYYEEALYFHDRNINVTLKPQSDPTASFVVDGYTDDQLQRLHNGMPQRAYTEDKKLVDRPHYKWRNKAVDNKYGKVPAHFEIEFTDKYGKKWYMDQAERFNAFNFNNFNGWECSSGYRSIIIREPDGTIKRSYSCHDEPLGQIETGFQLYDGPKICTTNACVSSADSKIPKRKPGNVIPLWTV